MSIINDASVILGKTYAEWVREFPIIKDIKDKKETFWKNGGLLPFSEAIKGAELGKSDVEDASKRLDRFANYFKKVFPETAERGGIIESPLMSAPKMKSRLDSKYGVNIRGSLMVKLDSHLAVSGSIKARGGIYEVLAFAEKIAMEQGGLRECDDYAVLDEERFKRIFSRYSVAVGSTGNLGLSIGIISAKLGFKVTVHMSADARQWKKDMLRERGVTVVEYGSDYSVAVANGRREAQGDPYCHFVDDENSRTLFLGYAVAAERLKKQLDEQGIVICKENPLNVYLPCGVGGGPGGVAFGLKLVFGDDVHCYFAEPTHSCCMMLGMATGLHSKISVGDLGVDNKTIADGLAVGRPSGFVGEFMLPFISGCYTVCDERLSALLATFFDEEGVFLEPSALAGFYGPIMLEKAGKIHASGIHLAWATGGNMVPDEERIKYYQRGKELEEKF